MDQRFEHPRKRLLSMEMDLWIRSCNISRIQLIPNAAIRDKVECQKNILYLIGNKRLKWYGHLMRTDENWWPRKLITICHLKEVSIEDQRKKWIKDIEVSIAAVACGYWVYDFLSCREKKNFSCS